jgi:hypothetical protein
MSDLITLAKTLRAQAQKHPEQPARYNLSRGLQIEIKKTGLYWLLRIARHGTTPSKTEERIVKEAFDVPQHAYRTESDAQNDFSVQWTWDGGTVQAAQPCPF